MALEYRKSLIYATGVLTYQYKTAIILVSSPFLSTVRSARRAMKFRVIIHPVGPHTPENSFELGVLEAENLTSAGNFLDTLLEGHADEFFVPAEMDFKLIPVE